MRSFTHSPDAVIHSPAAIVAACPTTVTRSRCPRAFARKTQNPFSALWKVTRSTSPASTSWVDDSGRELIGTIVSATFARTYGRGTDMPMSSSAIRLNIQGTRGEERRTCRVMGKANGLGHPRRHVVNGLKPGSPLLFCSRHLYWSRKSRRSALGAAHA